MTTYLQDSNGRVFDTEHPEYHKECKPLPSTQGKKFAQQQACKDLRKLLKPGSIVYTILRHVSKSGMQREISLVIPTKEGIRDITYLASVATDSRIGKNRGIVVGGCGMDMGFHLVYELGAYLWPKGTMKPHSERNGEPDNAGGYALRQSWL